MKPPLLFARREQELDEYYWMGTSGSTPISLTRACIEVISRRDEGSRPYGVAKTAFSYIKSAGPGGSVRDVGRQQDQVV